MELLQIRQTLTSLPTATPKNTNDEIAAKSIVISMTFCTNTASRPHCLS